VYESKITIVGNVGRTPEMRYTPAGVPVTDFSVAVNRSYTKDGETVERTKWYKVVCWRKLAEVTAQYLQKGRLVAVEGEIDCEAYTNKSGEVVGKLVITASTVKFLGKSNGSSADDGGEDAFGSGPAEDDIPF
jgi:single-strand DNA-binding protein